MNFKKEMAQTRTKEGGRGERDLRTTRVDGKACKQHGISNLWAQITDKNVEVA